MSIEGGAPAKLGTPFMVFICFVAALGGLLFGYDTVVIGGTINPVKAQFDLGATAEGWFVSSALFGCVIGVVAASFLSDRFGRKRNLIFSGFLLLLSALGCGLAGNFPVLIVSRIIGGIGVGLASSVSPLYISEVAPPHLRGRMVSLFQWTICVGIVVAMLVNSSLLGWAQSGEGGGDGFIGHLFVVEYWRGMFLAESLPALCFLLTCLMIPDSPRWLDAKGYKEKALGVLERIRGDQDAARAELREIEEAVLSEGEGGISKLLKPGLRKALFIGVFLAIFSELSGITIVMFYGPTIFENSGLPATYALNAHLIIGIVLTVSTLIAVGLVDVVGRRTLMMVGNTGCIVSLALIGLVLNQDGEQGGLLLVSMSVFVACFSFSLGPIKWIVISEIFPTRMRGTAVAVATLFLWITDVFLNQFFPAIREGIGIGNSFLFFAACLLVQLIFVWRVMPETKGRSLEEIERCWTS